ncbi:hypothetical protein [Ascidiaceihabitans sp.]|uniref:hypothetical protein n=1 Tax=Ascidiaceihabitans sp. TaxID=1872644 RepID=UPI00329A0D42
MSGMALIWAANVKGLAASFLWTLMLANSEMTDLGLTRINREYGTWLVLDRHVLAAAIRCSAQVIVTENHKDFPFDVIEEHGVETLSAHDFLANTYDLFPPAAARSLRKVRQRYDNPSMTSSEFLLDLTRSSLSKLAAAARADLEYI